MLCKATFLKGTRYFVNEDFSKETQAIRKYLKKVKELRVTHINPSFAKDVLLKEDIDLAANLFHDTKFQQFDSSYYTSDKLITFRHNSLKIVCQFFI